MDSPEINALPTSENQTTEYLSTTLETQPDAFTRRRSASVTPSIRSGRSDVTVLEEHSEVPVLDKKAIRRRRTQKVEIKISRWNCILGALFGSQIAERAAVTTITAPDMDDGDEDAFDNKECPYILSVHVLPSPNAKIQEHQQARCTFDTGCLQGNIVSKSFAQKVGFSEQDYKALNSRERHGGTSATGHTHMPVGALYLSWYHNSSPLLFRDMRFLVSSDQQCDIVIGAPSIVKHKLLSLPNFIGTSTTRLSTEDQEYKKLQSEVEKLESDIETRNLNGGKNKKIEELERKLEIAKAKLELYLARKEFEANTKDTLKKDRVDQLQRELDKLTPPKTEKPSPTLQVTGTNGKIRNATGFSSISVVRSRNRRQ